MKTSRVINLLIALTLAAALLPAAIPAAAQSIAPVANPGDYVPGEVVVAFESGKTASAYTAQAQALAGKVGASVLKQDGNTILFRFDPGANVEELSARIAASTGVVFAEPNYIYKIPNLYPKDPNYQPPTTIDKAVVVTNARGEVSTKSISTDVTELKSLRTIKNGRIAATYPNDPNLFGNWGWRKVGADIVWPNTTPSVNICLLDTGTDYTHPDLIRSGVPSVIKGWDFINNDADPMDDNGHGTHTAGIMVATTGNAQGIAGISNGKVVAVKVLNAQGWGTNFGVAAGINYCASRLDVKVLNMSLSGGYSKAIEDAVNYAVNVKGKLIVASAGNDNTDVKSYPAGFADNPLYVDKVLAVAAIDNGNTTEVDCRASYSNYGSWVSITAPGTDILSTMPYKKTFYMGYYGWSKQDYDNLSGTSMAAPFVSGAAARRWGYKPTSTNAQVGLAVKSAGQEVNADDTCWPSSMSGVRRLNVAALLDRSALLGWIYSATTGNPINNAQLLIYQGLTLRGSGFTPETSINAARAEVLNLPVGNGYNGKVNKIGYTNGAQPAFWHAGLGSLEGGNWYALGTASIPEKSSNFTVTVGWDVGLGDLDMYALLPDTPNPLDPGQPANFVVGWSGNTFGYLEGDSTGTLIAFPYAIYNLQGGRWDGSPSESITISNRKAHSPILANAALPYYPGHYYVGVTDYGQITTPYGQYAANVMFWALPNSYIWKDGRILAAAYDYGCNDTWWFPWDISSGLSGTSPTISFIDYCGATSNPHSTALSSTNRTGVKMK